MSLGQAFQRSDAPQPDEDADEQFLTSSLDDDEQFLAHPQEAPQRGKQFELNELCGLIMGAKYKRAYEILFLVYILGVLWAYASVFGSSVATRIPVSFLNGGHTCDVSTDLSSACSSLYLFWLFIFALITVPLTCMDLSETKFIQVTLTIFRFIAIIAIMGTSIYALYNYPNDKFPPGQRGTSPPYYSDLKAVDAGGIGVIIPVAITALIFHHAIPGLSHPVKDKTQLPAIYAAVLVVIFVIYSSLGLVVGLYYGSTTEAICTLNWANYTGTSGSDASASALLIRYLVVLFPPIDILSAYPLNANVLGNNLLTAFVSDPKQQQARKAKIFFRVLAAAPPIAGAMIVHDLGKILQFRSSSPFVRFNANR